jgi:hypothetical protein
MSNAKHHQSSSELKEIAGVDDYDWQEASNVKASAAGTNSIGPLHGFDAAVTCQVMLINFPRSGC